MGGIKAALILKEHRRAEGYKSTEDHKRHADCEAMQIRCETISSRIINYYKNHPIVSLFTEYIEGVSDYQCHEGQMEPATQ